jgi:hypothetical protein
MVGPIRAVETPQENLELRFGFDRAFCPLAKSEYWPV